MVSFEGYRDHHNLKSNEVQDLIWKKESLKADFLLTTEKDWVRMGKLIGEYPDLAYLRIKFTLLSGEAQFFKMIKERIG